MKPETFPSHQGAGAGAMYLVKLQWGFTWERGEFRPGLRPETLKP